MYSYTIVLFAHITRSFMRIRSCKVANTCMTYGWDMSSALIFGWGVGGRAGKPWNGCSRQEKNGGDWETRSITFHTSHNTEDIAILTHTASIQILACIVKSHMEEKKGLELEHISIQLLQPWILTYSVQNTNFMKLRFREHRLHIIFAKIPCLFRKYF